MQVDTLPIFIPEKRIISFSSFICLGHVYIDASPCVSGVRKWFGWRFSILGSLRNFVGFAKANLRLTSLGVSLYIHLGRIYDTDFIS